jgi:hypothetical protein
MDSGRQIRLYTAATRRADVLAWFIRVMVPAIIDGFSEISTLSWDDASIFLLPGEDFVSILDLSVMVTDMGKAERKRH